MTQLASSAIGIVSPNSRLGSLPAVALLSLASACAHGADPVALLGEPGLPGRFQVLADGSVRAGASGSILAEWLATGGEAGRPDSPAAPQFSWLAPGACVVRSVRTEGDVELTTVSGADGHGRLGEQALWLFRSVRLSSGGPAKREVRLCVTLSGGGLSLRDDCALLAGEEVRLVVSRKPDEVREAEGQTVLAFDVVLAPKGSASLFLAAPAEPTPYRLRDVPDVRNLDPDLRLRTIADDWQGQVLPDRLTVGDARTTEAFHAAVGSLLLDPPPPDDLQAVASALSALARAGHAPRMHRALEALVAGQAEDGRFAGVTETGLQADLTAALADCALYSEAPERWARVLWRPISRSAEVLERGEVAAACAARVVLALSRAADVADVVGDEARAEALRTRVKALPVAAPDAPPASTFEARGRALQCLAGGAQPPTVDRKAALGELLLTAGVAVLAADPKARQRAWDAAEAGLEAQALPGVWMSGETEDATGAAALIWLVADSALRMEGGGIHCLPALPTDWGDGGPLVRLEDFPSGLGPVRLEATVSEESGVTLSVPKLPKLAQRLLVSPPLGAEVGGLRANGKPLSPEAFAAGPPWSLNPSTWSVALLPSQ